MTRNLQRLLITLFLITLPIIWSDIVSAKSIRDQVIKETGLDEQVALFCRQYCRGNERKGYLKGVTVELLKTGHYRVVGKAALQNRHVVKKPFVFVLFDRTVIIAASGTLNPDNCKLQIDNVSVENDFYDVFNGILRNQGNVIGRVERIPNCRRFIE